MEEAINPVLMYDFGSFLPFSRRLSLFPQRTKHRDVESQYAANRAVAMNFIAYPDF
jgi:hypothetical protein